MKAVIVDIKGMRAVALSKKGDFIKIKNNKKFEIGSEVEITENTSFKITTYIKIASMAAVFLLVAGLGFGVYSYNNPYSYIDIDINPSIEVTSNVFDRIINVKALNKDGEKVIGSVNYKNMKIHNGIQEILQSAVKNGYLKTNSQNAVMFTVSSKNQNRALNIEDEVKGTADGELKTANVESEILVEKTSVERHDEAKNIGISPGKLLLIQRLQESNPAALVEDYKDSPVKDIMKEINEAHKGEKAQTKDVKEIKGSPAGGSSTQVGGANTGSAQPRNNGNNGAKNHTEGSIVPNQGNDGSTTESNQGNNGNGKGQDKEKEEHTDKDKEKGNNGNGKK